MLKKKNCAISFAQTIKNVNFVLKIKTSGRGSVLKCNYQIVRRTRKGGKTNEKKSIINFSCNDIDSYNVNRMRWRRKYVI